MTLTRQLGCLFALLVGVAAPAAAQQQSYDPSYEADRRYDDRYDERDQGRYEGGRRLVRCESRDGRTQYCAVDTRGGVRLMRQLSDRRCVRGQNWGVSERGLWVSKGCRGEFEIGYDYRYGRRFRCESTDNRTKYCSTDTRYGVRLVRQLSRNACVEGRSWGVTRNSVWVSRGCRAEFVNNDSYYRDQDYRDGEYRDGEDRDGYRN